MATRGRDGDGRDTGGDRGLETQGLGVAGSGWVTRQGLGSPQEPMELWG